MNADAVEWSCSVVPQPHTVRQRHAGCASYVDSIRRHGHLVSTRQRRSPFSRGRLRVKASHPEQERTGPDCSVGMLNRLVPFVSFDSLQNISHLAHSTPNPRAFLLIRQDEPPLKPIRQGHPAPALPPWFDRPHKPIRQDCPGPTTSLAFRLASWFDRTSVPSAEVSLSLVTAPRGLTLTATPIVRSRVVSTQGSPSSPAPASSESILSTHCSSGWSTIDRIISRWYSLARHSDSGAYRTLSCRQYSGVVHHSFGK